jgi:hypothetical protein
VFRPNTKRKREHSHCSNQRVFEEKAERMFQVLGHGLIADLGFQISDESQISTSSEI